MAVADYRFYSQSILIVQESLCPINICCVAESVVYIVRLSINGIAYLP